MNSVWEKLSAIDCAEKIEKKGNLSYLSWAWAWGMVKKHYPDANYEVHDDHIYPDDSVMTSVSVTIDAQTHTMWLPVMDNRNNAIAKPDARKVSDARMRCLVKAIAMHGLGHYIYAGEDLPETEPFTAEQNERFLSLLAEKDGWGLKHFAREVGNDVMTALFNNAPAGHKTKIKNQVRVLVNEANAELKVTIEAIEQALDEQAASSLEEIFAELKPTEYDFVVAGITPVQHQQIINMGVSV